MSALLSRNMLAVGFLQLQEGWLNYRLSLCLVLNSIDMDIQHSSTNRRLHFVFFPDQCRSESGMVCVRNFGRRYRYVRSFIILPIGRETSISLSISLFYSKTDIFIACSQLSTLSPYIAGQVQPTHSYVLMLSDKASEASSSLTASSLISCKERYSDDTPSMSAPGQACCCDGTGSQSPRRRLALPLDGQ